MAGNAKSFSPPPRKGGTFGAYGFPLPTPRVLRQGYVLCERAPSLRSLSDGTSKVLGGCFSAFLSAGKNVILNTAGERRHPSRNATQPQNRIEKQRLCLYGGVIVQAVSVFANDSKSMVLQDKESAQGLLNAAVKIKTSACV